MKNTLFAENIRSIEEDSIPETFINLGASELEGFMGSLKLYVDYCTCAIFFEKPSNFSQILKMCGPITHCLLIVSNSITTNEVKFIVVRQ